MHIVTLALAIHTVAAVFLVGGLIFALVIMRPSAQALEEDTNLTLWRDSLQRFLVRGWIALALLLGSGHAMIRLTYGHLASTPLFVRVMLGLGLVIAAVFAYLQFFPWRHFRQAVQLPAGRLRSRESERCAWSWRSSWRWVSLRSSSARAAVTSPEEVLPWP